MLSPTAIYSDCPVTVKDPLSIQFRDFEAVRRSTEHRVVQGEVSRPDLISFFEYNTVGFWWFIAAINGVVDPLDMPEQELVLVPQLLDYFDWFREQKGT